MRKVLADSGWGTKDTFYPGVLEFQFLKGQSDERAKRIALLMGKYMKAVKEQTPWIFSPSTPSGVRNVIPVQKIRLHISTVLPYEEALRLVEKTEHIAVGICSCRHLGELRDKPRTKPKENMCFILGSSAEHAAKRGLARLISKEEVKHLIQVADEVGLVHNYTDRKDDVFNYLCNCCGCHCSLLRGIMHSPSPSDTLTTNWTVTIQDEDCVGCGACIDRCWTKALKMENEVAIHDAKRCIGCGLCVSVCPTDAIKLVSRHKASA